MDWVAHRPILAAGLAVFLVGFVASRWLANGLLDLLDDAQKLRVVASASRSPVWLVAFVASAVLALLWPRLGIFALAGYFAVATGVRLRWLGAQALPPQFMRRASQSAWVLVAGFLALALAVQF